MAQLNVLVSGAGIAGSVVAYWLAKSGWDVTMIERAPKMRVSGQGIDVRGSAVHVMRKMGVEDAVRAKTTKELGMMFVDEKNLDLATLEESGSSSFTADIEIIRSDLAQILADAALSTGKVKQEFDVSITSINQSSSRVTVELSNGQSRDYDLVIAADGLGSKTRKILLGPEKSKSGFKSLNCFAAYFSIPREPQDGPRSRWYTTTEGRACLVRPVDQSKSSVYLNYISSGQAVRDAVSSNNIETQKQFLATTFENAGWEIPRVLKGMQSCDSDQFYFQEIAQITLDPSSWHQGRVALVGDAAYCPSALTGMGTTLAIMGAYILAGEIVSQIKESSSSPPNFETAFQNYEKHLGAYVKETQALPLGGALVSFLNPQTSWGVWILRKVLWTMDRSGAIKLLTWAFGDLDTKGLKVPEYSFWM